MLEAMPIVLLSVLIINVLQQIKIFDIISRFFSPILVFIFGLPKEAVWALIIGLLRKDIAAGMLIPLNLSLKQLIIACIVLSMSFPCIATFVIFFKELGVKRLLQATALMLLLTAVVGGLLNIVLI
ncbi:MAG: nucleoside recognition domain-containing protein [Candidatus Omnitrophota bacterium]